MYCLKKYLESRSPYKSGLRQKKNAAAPFVFCKRIVNIPVASYEKQSFFLRLKRMYDIMVQIYEQVGTA